jgi:DNA-binding SARP family transcriptional activator
VDFRVLGPVELWAAGQRRDLGSAKERCVLAVLLWALGNPVAADSLVDRVWGENPPPKARDSLYSYIARLRGRLRQAGEDGQARLVSGSGTYTLEADPETVDLYRFRRLRAQARAIGDSGDDEQAALLLREADGLWRGEPLTGLAGSWVGRARASLADERLAATLDRVAAELRLGRHADVLGEITDLIADHPFVETLVEHLMVALYRCGRQAEALQAYRQARQRLTEELGADPSPSLRDLHQQILRGDAGLARSPLGTWTSRAPTFDNLPRDIPNFTGRAAEMRQLLAAATAEPARTAVVIQAIDGMAGAGKSTLALHAAHQLHDHFPDARIYLHLHAHDAHRRPLDPAAGLGTLLRILGVPADHIPRTLEERATLWRTQLASRRAIIVLDDAASQEQVAPLLPGTPSCLVIITSRNRLAGLSGVRALSLGVLSGADAAALFANIAGSHRASDGESVAEITRLCGYLPLAIHLVASRLAHRPAWSVADLAQRLSDTGDRTGEIYLENPEIAASFALSYQELSTEQQQLFRQMSLHPGPDFTLAAAAASACTALADCERCVTALLDHRMLEEPARGRFRYQDLIGAYARDLALRYDHESQRRQTVRRMLDYYLSAADKADRILYPHRDRMDVQVALPPTVTPHLASPQEARDWLTAESANLLSGARYADDHRLPEHAALIGHVLARFLQIQGHWEDAVAAHDRAIRAWRMIGDRNGEARALTDLGSMLTRTGRYADALKHALEALAIFRADDDRHGEAKVLDRMGLVYWQSSRFKEALAHYEQALVIWRALGDRHGEADSLGHSAMCMWHVGSYDEAMRRFARALGIYREMADRQGEAKSLNNIADVQLHLGLYDEALRRYQQAQAIAQETGDRQGEAVTHNNMGNFYQRIGQYADSLSHYRNALAIYRDIGDRRCEADALNNIGSAFQRTHNYGEAIIHHQKALAVAHELAEPYQEARSLSSTGAAQLMGGRHDLALQDYRAALELSRLIGDPYQEGLALDGIGSVRLHTDGSSAARECWRAALAIFEKIGVPEAAEVRARLGRTETGGR